MINELLLAAGVVLLLVVLGMMASFYPMVYVWALS